MRRLTVLALALAAGCGGPGSPAGPAPGSGGDPDGEEAIRLLQEFIRIDTVNPPLPGSSKPNAGETALLRRVQGILAAEGIESEILESAPGRGNLVARWRGTGAKRPILLMAHVDVVGFEAAQWEADPLSGVVRDGFVWGRGALDDKDDAAIFVQVMRILARTRPRLSRDVVLMLNADEESSGRYGARWMVERHWDKIACEYALSEGGRSSLEDGKVVEVGIQTAEKVYNDFRLWVRGRSGHSSVPLKENAIFALGRMLARLDGFQPPLRLTETAAASLAARAELPKYAGWREEMKRAAAGEPAAAEKLCGEPRFNALLRSTFVPTIVQGGIRANVLPSEAEVNFNARLLPGERIDDLVQSLLERLGMPQGEIVEGDAAAIERWKRERKDVPAAVFLVERGVDAPASPLGTEMYRALAETARRLAPGAVVAPQLQTGATDLRFLRLKGVHAYGLGPCPTGDAEEGTVHGPNERVRVESVRFGARLVRDAVLEAAR